MGHILYLKKGMLHPTVFNKIEPYLSLENKDDGLSIHQFNYKSLERKMNQYYFFYNTDPKKKILFPL
jgi:hypothetical protein